MRILAFALLLVAPQALYGADLVLQEGTAVRLADARQAGDILRRQDDFIKALSPFDRCARLETKEPVSTEQFLDFVSRQALEFSEAEADNLAAAVAGIREAIVRLGHRLPLPPAVFIVKTTGKEEAGAAYHRSDAIVLPQKFLRLPPNALTSLLAHELFHVMTGCNADLRRDLYALLGFAPCDDVALPEGFAARKISNPDSPRNDFSIAVDYRGKSIRVIPVLFASAAQFDPSGGRTLFHYLQQRLMAVEEDNGHIVPSIVDGKPLMLEAREVPDYGLRLGEAMEYLIQPEEVLAINFASLLAGQEHSGAPQVLQGMRRLLSKDRGADEKGQPRDEGQTLPAGSAP